MSTESPVPRHTWVVASVLALIVGVTVWAQSSGTSTDSQDLTSFTGPPDRGGPTRRQAGVIVGSATVIHEQPDIVLRESLGDFVISRQFGTSPSAPIFHSDWCGHSICPPLAPSGPLGLFGGLIEGHLIRAPWDLNLDSYVEFVPGTVQPPAIPDRVSVRLPGGQVEKFNDCSLGAPAQCAASFYGANGTLFSRNPSAPNDGYPAGPGYVYRAPSGERYIFTGVYIGDGSIPGTSQNPGTSTTKRWYLIAVESARYKEATGQTPVKYTITYAQPSGCTTSGAAIEAGSTPGVPYISRVTTGDGAVLLFNYASSGQCRLTSIARQTPAGSTTLVSYSYGSDPTAMAAYFPETGEQLTYTPAIVGPDWTWTAGRDGGPDLARYTLDAGVVPFPTPYGMFARAYLDEDRRLGYSTIQAVSCDGGAFPLCITSLTDDDAGSSGLVAGGTTTLRETYLAEGDLTYEGELVKDYAVTCRSGSCASYTPKHEAWYVQTLSNHMTVSQSHFSANGSWDLYSNTVNANGWREFLSAAHGASSQTDPNPPDSTGFSYEYHSPKGVPEQFVSTSTKASVVQGGSSVMQVRVYDPNGGVGSTATNRLKAEFITGYTRSLDGTVSSKTIGKFYFTAFQSGCGTGSPDQLGRTLEVHGPCYVNGTGALDCDPSTVVPVTQLAYYPANDVTELGFNGNKLKSKTTIVQQASVPYCSGTRFTTTYGSYDSRGRPTVITDPNNTTTTRTYQGEWLMAEVRSGGGMSASEVNTYDVGTGTVSSTTHAAGNRELFCYRTGATTACSGGQPSRNLQWKARVTSSGSVLERVDYLYQHGKVIKETYSYGTGSARRVVNHIYDAQGRLASDGPGSTDFVFSRASYDAMDSPTGLGAPYNSPSELCGANATGLPADAACSVLTYDTLERLASAKTPSTGGTSSSTCVSYDKLGHVSAIAMGVTGMTCAQALSGGTALAQYAYDDFGRLLSVTAPWMGTSSQSSGTTSYEYDALGNIIKKQTPAMREAPPSGEYLSYDYDSLGRVLAAWHQHPGGTPAQEMLYGFAYDGATTLAGVTVPANCTFNTLGRVRIRADSFGSTFYSYNAFGQVTDEFRVRAGALASCSVNGVGSPNDLTPSTHRAFSTKGLLTDLVYPHGRHLKYTYGGSGSEDRLATIQYGDWSSGLETFKTLLRNIQYEPYGSVAGYEHVAPTITTNNIVSVEYLPGAPSVLPSSQVCNAARPSSLDGSGRLAALWVSKASLGSGSADLLRKTYTWKADQLVAEDSCTFTTTGASSRTYFATPGTIANGYDSRLQLVRAARPAGEFGAKGGAFGNRSYAYDTRGNRTADTSDCFGWTNTYSSFHGDQLQSRSVTSGCMLMPTPKLTVKYGYDSDGRASRKSWPSPSNPAVDAKYLSFDASIDGAHAAVGAVYKAVTVNGVIYEYYYDADGRRRAKLYPTGGKDEYFYDTDNSLLEDRGLDGSGAYTLDEYIWLGGRPVALLRSKLTSAWARQADRAGTCTRNTVDSSACDVYGIVTDYLPKPVALIDSSARLSGVADYDPFGHVNRVASPGDSAHHPYQSGDHRILGYFNQPAGTGLSVDVRPRFAIFSAAGTTTAYLADINEASIGQIHTATDNTTQAAAWTAVPSSGVFRLAFKPGDSNPGGLDGIVSEGYEYRRYQTGATAAWLPIRFPGQYHDAETDLFQNWSRFYDPALGRYLEPDPLWLYPEQILPLTRQLHSPPVYGYAYNNPIVYSDPDGRDPCANANACSPTGVQVIKAWLAAGAAQAAKAASQAGQVAKAAAPGVGRVVGVIGFLIPSNIFQSYDETYHPPTKTATIQEETKAEEGSIYVVDPDKTSSGRPYVGSADDLEERAKDTSDGRDRTGAAEVDTYPIGDREQRRTKEQQWINDLGGVELLDNKRNEVAPKYWPVKGIVPPR